MQANYRHKNIQQALALFDIGAPDILLDDLVLDSREVGVHTGFVAIKGHALDGRDFIPQAISLGAKLVISETEEPLIHGKIEMREQTIIVHFYQLASRLSELAAAFYAYPANHMNVVAVTGTNGKTSTVQLIAQFADLSGTPSATIGTLGAGILGQGSDQYQTINTTPDACQMQKLLADFVVQQAGLVAYEASSHALVQKRITGVKTDVAVFTNLTRDHLDYHRTMQEYAKAKRLLIEQPGLHTLVLNYDDQESHNWLNHALADQQIILCSMKDCCSDMPSQARYCIAQNICYQTTGSTFTLLSSWGTVEIVSTLLGKFNVANLLQAIATQLALGMPLQQVASLCSQLQPVPGRMELFLQPKHGNIIVDYAHTPDALEQALSSARIHCNGQLICVFGCGGDRDKGKRPLMGQIAQRFSDKVIVTTDNSRSESPQQIVNDILAGMEPTPAPSVVLDRKLAIQQALLNSKPQDLIMVAGKGHENTQLIGSQVLAYDEREYVNSLSQENLQ